ncbi:type II CRISPR RNA-guided endonuclease Cas9 [Lacihabitans lacunae]|uniref:CRISPR-associated endonuclease Cas9 n=1 Tax=Lacihabitans lacunae TaxID=1028214 RepID=A0ABV7YW88_9BACT
MKKILGLDLGTNSIGWALVNLDFDTKNGNIEGLGSRIIPMTQDVLGKFDSGVSISQTAERTGYRGVRRLRQRLLLRRERLHRVLNILGFLPEHYKESIDFENKLGKIKPELEPKLAYSKDDKGNFTFLFESSFLEMVNDFKSQGKEDLKIPYDWTIYYLRKKALTRAITKEELAWLILNFNQKRGYYQLRGEEEANESSGKIEEFYKLKVKDVREREKGKSGIWYDVILENDWIYKRESKTPLNSWIGSEKEFIVTTELNEDGSIKRNKENEEKRSFRAPKEDDWNLLKIRTEKSILDTDKTVGAYIYDSLLENPSQKIKGELVRTIERKFYKSEFIKILKSQTQFHPELQDEKHFSECVNHLYKNNEAHRNNIKNRNFEYLFTSDIIFYQRPLKSKTSLISDCKLEFREFSKNGILIKQPLKCVPKSHPLFQEFRLWQFIQNLKIFKKDPIDDIDLSSDYLNNEEALTHLFEILNDKKDITQKQFLAIYKLKEDNFKWNYVEDKTYPCNETRNLFLSKTLKIEGFEKAFFTPKVTEELWHILYSVSDKIEIESAIHKFASKHGLTEEFEKIFSKLPPFKNEYGAYSLKAIKKLLPLMRTGKFWSKENIALKTLNKIENVINGVYDEKISLRFREKAVNFTEIDHFRALPLWFASYVVYDRHSESNDLKKWNSPNDIENYLKKEFRQHSLRNPIVEQVITETLRVVRDIWNEYGNGKANFFDEIHVELGREMKNPADKRKQISEQVSRNENTNIRIRAILEELKSQGLKDIRPYSPSQQEILKIYEDGVYSNESRKDELETIEKIRRNSKPTSSEIQKYKLWLDQGYISPYTGNIIKLSDLFTTKYQIEHIFPQSRFFDDSMTNKIICESEVNALKDNQTAMEFILKHGGETVTLNGGKNVKISEVKKYEEHVKSYFTKNKTKLKNLLSVDIPESFINRQLNDSRYISKVIKNYLSNIVRADNNEKLEIEAISKNVVPVTGSITSQMKQDWGLNEIWNELITPRFERLNEISKSNDFGQWENKQGKNIFQISVPEKIAKGFSKKRIDHRHHALDALVIACITKDHVNYLNSLNSKNDNHGLVSKLRKIEEYTKDGKTRKAAKDYLKPWKNFTIEALVHLSKTIVSFKQNTKVIKKAVNKYEKIIDGKKTKVTQTKGENWAIRKPMHAETVSGKVLLKRVKETKVSISSVLEDINLVVDSEIKKILKEKATFYNGNLSGFKKHLKESPIIIDKEKIDKVEIFEFIEATATRKKLDTTFDEKRILKITDTDIQKILLNHLAQGEYQNVRDEKKNLIPAHELAFNEEGLAALNQNIVELNGGKKHQPIKKVRIFEEGSKFALGETGNKKDKYVEAAKGTNLFFAVYVNSEGKRNFKTIPLNEVIESQKLGLNIAPEEDENSNKLVFTLSPNDLVYCPTEEEMAQPFQLEIHNASKTQSERIYKLVSFSGSQAFFVQNSIATMIADKIEFSALNKTEKSIDGIMIKSVCWKLKINRLGKLEK